MLLLLATLGAVYTLLLEPIALGYGEADRQIEEVREQLSHYQRLASMRPALERQVHQSAAEATSEGYYLSGGTDALAAASLQDQVSSLVQSKGGTLRSIQPMPGVDEQGFRRITLRIQMSANTEALFETLYALEAGMPILFVDNLDIQSRLVRSRNSEGSQTAPDAPVLTVAFDLSGYLPVESH